MWPLNMLPRGQPACSRRAHSYAMLQSQVLPSGRAGLKAFLTQFLDSYTIVCINGLCILGVPQMTVSG